MDESEIWRDIPGYEGRYQASNLGRIKSMARCVRRVDSRTGKDTSFMIKEKILKASRFNKTGHISVFLRDEQNPKGIGKPVHQLVAATFIGKKSPQLLVLHRNGNPNDNSLSNLHYGTKSENGEDRYRHANAGLKLTTDDVIEIRKLIKLGISQREIARQFNVSDTTVYYIKRGERFKWLK